MPTMIDELRDLDLRAIFASLRLSADLPREIFARRSTRRLPGAVIEPARVGEPELPPPGYVLGTYRLERAIGIGGCGAVYRARHVVLDNVVAIKLMRPSVVRSRPARIDHPNVVRVIDVATTGAHTYIVMEHVDGPDLSVMLRRKGALPPKVVVRVLRHVAAALAAGLAEQLIHRDVKPSNILLTRAGITKLADFGLAPTSAADAAAVIGTATYGAPEQVSDPQRVDFRSDIYSLGITAYHALTGRLPPETPGGTPRDRDRAPSQFAVVPVALDDLVVAATAPRPSDRPASYESLEAALRALR